MLTWLDLVLLGVLGLSAIVGLWRGFIVETLSLVVWVAAFWLAFHYGADAAALFATSVEAEQARLLLGHALLFLAALVIGGLATWLIGKLVRSTGLGGTDRLLGLVFGLVRGAALGAVVVLLLGFTRLPQEPWWASSRVLPAFQSGAEWLRDWLPEAVARHVSFSALPLPVPTPGSGPVLPAPAAPQASPRPPSS